MTPIHGGCCGYENHDAYCCRDTHGAGNLLGDRSHCHGVDDHSRIYSWTMDVDLLADLVDDSHQSCHGGGGHHSRIFSWTTGKQVRCHGNVCRGVVSQVDGESADDGLH